MESPTLKSPLILDGSKLAWHSERVQLWKEGKRVVPVTIDCSLAAGCTYACMYCYGKLQCMDNTFLPREVILRFLDDAAQMGVKAVSFVSDGESTCNPHLYESILHGYNNGLDMALGTNGYLLRDDQLPIVLPCLTYLRFNISSGTPKGYSKVHGVSEKCFYKVISTIRKAVEIKKKHSLDVTLGLQMVLMPQLADEIMPLAALGKNLGVDYLVIKHCSDDENGTLGVCYEDYSSLEPILHAAESLSTPTYFVKAKWSKILSGGKRCYSKCYGPNFILQISGTGLVAPCGMFFNKKYKKFHIGNIRDSSLKSLWKSQRWQDVMNSIHSEEFDARTDCGTLCLQHNANEILWDLCENNATLKKSSDEVPRHVNFI